MFRNDVEWISANVQKISFLTNQWQFLNFLVVCNIQRIERSQNNYSVGFHRRKLKIFWKVRDNLTKVKFSPNLKRVTQFQYNF